jgi:putative hydrolase of the HAD superfamily
MALVSEFDGFIFDYGGVLVFQQTKEDQAAMAALAKIPPEQFAELYWADREQYDKGAVSTAEYWGNIGAAAGVQLNADQIQALTDRDTESWMKYDSVMWDWIAELRRAGKRVGMLSNMPADLGLALRSQTDRLAAFDQVTLSFDVGAVKPDAVIYEQCLEGLGTAPDRTLFLDDRLENVQGAEVLGMRAIQFTDRDDVLLKIRGE